MTHNLTRSLAVVAMMALLLALSAPKASAIVISGDTLYAEAGETYSVTYDSREAGYFSLSFLDQPSEIFLFDGNASAGDTADLGAFAAGSELIFRLDVTNTSRTYYSGETDNPGRNPDSFQHLRVTQLADDLYELAWEDLFNGGDEDYNDMIFTLSVVPDDDPDRPVIPEPATLLLVGLGTAGSLLSRRRIRR